MRRRTVGFAKFQGTFFLQIYLLKLSRDVRFTGAVVRDGLHQSRVDGFNFGLKLKSIFEPSFHLAFVQDAHQVFVRPLCSGTNRHANTYKAGTTYRRTVIPNFSALRL